MAPTTQEWNVFGTKARAARSLGLAIVFIVTIAVWLVRQNDSVLGAVQRAEFIDSTRALRADIMTNRGGIDSAIAKVTDLIQESSRQQIRAVCQTAAQRDPEAALIQLCRDARHQP